MAVIGLIHLVCIIFFVTIFTKVEGREIPKQQAAIQAPKDGKPNIPLKVSWDKISWTADIRGNNMGELVFALFPAAERTLIPYPKDCKDIKSENSNSQNGVYTIYPGYQRSPVDVYCEMTLYGGGWTVIQRRFDGSVDFKLNWTDYKNGFGSPYGEYWIGNDNIHFLTTNDESELIVDLQDFNGVWKQARYSDFEVESEENGYNLTSIGTYSGNAGDSLKVHENMKFSTPDKDNDKKSTNCAEYFSAWWHKDCYHSNLNDKYLHSEQATSKSMNWYHFSGASKSLKESVMMIRKKQ